MSNNPEVMVVLSDGGKPVSVIRALDDDGDVIGRGQMLLSEKSTSAGARKPADAKRNFSANRSDKDDRSKGKEFKDQTELKRLRTENSLLLQRIEHLEKQQQQQQATVAGDCEPDVESCRSDVATSSTSATEDDCSPDVQRLHDELVASKLREAEAYLSMKEFEQKLVQLQRHWQCFVDDNQSGFGAKTSSQAELRDTVMALRLREASLVSDMSALKRRLIELETQNHVNERKIKRQEAEQASLVEALSVAELRESDLQNSVAELQLKLSIVESKCKEDDVMSRIRDAEHSQLVEQMRRRIAELEIENQELVTATQLQNRHNSTEHTQHMTLLQDEESCAYDEADDVRVTLSDDVISGIDNVTFDQSTLLTSSLLLQPDDDVAVTSSVVDEDAWTDGQTRTVSSSIS